MRGRNALQANFCRTLLLDFAKLWECARVLASLFASQSSLGANAPELESGLGFYDFAIHLKQRIDQKINRSTFRLRVDHQIATLRQLKPVRRIMTKIIIRQL